MCYGMWMGWRRAPSRLHPIPLPNPRDGDTERFEGGIACKSSLAEKGFLYLGGHPYIYSCIGIIKLVFLQRMLYKNMFLIIIIINSHCVFILHLLTITDINTH